MASEDATAETLQWFRSNFSQAEKDGRISMKDFKHASHRNCHAFAENFFNLFDLDHSGSVSLQELMGGIGRLVAQSKKRKHLKWFEEVFVHLSEDDQPLQIDEFQTAIHTDRFLERLYDIMVCNNEDLTMTVMINAFSNIASTDRDHRWLEWFEQKFSGLPDEISFQEFKSVFHIKESFFAERFFHIFDKKKRSEHISLKELKEGLSQLINGTETDKLRFLFQVYDIDGNGHVDFEDLRTVLKACMGENALQFNDDQLDELTRALIEDADATNSGTLTFEELQTALSKHPGLVENLSFSAANWFQPDRKYRRRRRIKRIPHWMRLQFLRNNLTWIIWLCLYFATNIILFAEAADRYKTRGPAVAIARGCGACLNFNPMFVLVLMFRHVLSWIRSTRIYFLFPLDNIVKFHKIVGWMIFFFALVHTFAHVANFTLVSMRPGSLPLWQYFFGVQTGVGWVFGTAGLTGVFLIIILAVMVFCALSCIRKKEFFEVFYWTHNLFVPWYILLVLHGPSFWKWFVAPALIYMIERIVRSKWVELARYGRFYIKSASTLPSKVVYLALTRPKRFNYQPGDYVFIKIPSIAKYEWHPFTMSSSPEQDFLGFHVRCVGTWTNKLYAFVQERNKTLRRDVEQAERRLQLEIPRSASGSQREIQSAAISFNKTQYRTQGSIEVISEEGEAKSKHETAVTIESGDVAVDDGGFCKRLEVFIDGPYGTPSMHIFQAEHAVLIGAGIGVTPFASILQSVASKYRNARQVCPQCHHGWTGEIPTTVLRLKKVDFFWISRDQRSFEWFVSLLTNLEIEESDRVQNGFDRFLDFHLYMTAALRKTDMKAIGLQMALDLIHKKENRDLITGLRTRTQTGRPDWNKVFQKLAAEKKGKVSVFYCGPPAITKILKAKCAKYKFEFRREHF